MCFLEFLLIGIIAVIAWEFAKKNTYEATLNIYENNKKFKNPTQTAGNFAEILTLQSNCERPCMRIENYRVRIFRDSGTGGGGEGEGAWVGYARLTL